MISSGLSIVFAALFPFLPYQFAAPEHIAWAASSAFVTALTAGNLAFFTPRFVRARRAGLFGIMVTFELLLYLISFVLLVSQVLNMIGVGLARSPGGFLIGLYLMVLISSLNFVFLLYVLGRPRRHPPGPDIGRS